MTDTLALSLRVGFSLLFVLGLMWLAARVFRGKLGARGAGVIEVVARQQVTRGASIAVVRVGATAYVVGVTETSFTMLGDPIADLASVVPVVPTDAASAGAGSVGAASQGTSSLTATPGALGGSILSPGTWRQTMAALRERTVRRK